MPPSDLRAPGTQMRHTYTYEDKTLKHIKQIKHNPVVRVSNIHKAPSSTPQKKTRQKIVAKKKK